MKPVIKKQTHYSLLLMRDDSEARTYRVHGGFLRLFLWFLLVLVAGGSAGVAGSVYYWKKYRALGERHDAQEREISEMRLQLERLVALETVLTASNGTIPQSRHAEIGVSGSAPLTRNASASSALPGGTPAVRNATAAHNATSAAEATLPAANATESAAGNAALTGDALRPPGQEAAHPRIASGESPLRVAGFIARATGQQRLRISYELSTEGNDEQRMIAGMVRYFAIFSNGTRVELPSYDSDGSRFSITRMKLMQSSARLPQGYRAADVEKIDMLIELSEDEKFEERFEVNSVQ